MAIASLLALAACGGPPSQEGPPPPPMSSAPAPAASPDLLGGPPQPPPSPAAEPAPPSDFHMAPVANPEDMAPDERARVYGHRYDYLDHPGARSRLGDHHHHRHHARGGHGHAGGAAGRPGFTSAPGGGAPAGKSAPPATSKPPAVQPAPPAAYPSAPPSANGAPNKLSTDGLGIPGAPMVDVPGVGKTPSKTLVAIGLLLLALAILVFAIRGVPARQRPRSAAASRPIDLGASIAATPHEPSAAKPPAAGGENKPG